MAVMSEFQKERDTIKNASWPVKLGYFWQYYKWYVIIPALVLMTAFFLIYGIATKKEPILSGILLNSYTENRKTQQTVIDDFMAEYEIDKKEYEINIRNSLSYVSEEERKNLEKDSAQIDNVNITRANSATLRVMMAQADAGILDFVTADPSTMKELYTQQHFAVLSNMLTMEQLEQYKDYLVYVGNTPVFFDLSNCTKLTDFYDDKHETLYLGIISSTKHYDTVLNFIDFLIEK